MIAGLVLWIVGIPVAIWRPRKGVEGSSQGRAYLAIRRAAAWLLASYVLLVLPGLSAGDDPLPTVLLALVSLAAFILWPLATAALALDMRRRWLALPSTVLALLFAAGLTWYGALLVVVGFVTPYLPTWHIAVALLAALLGLGACIFIMETYALIRRPDPA
jgi:hypothetical protein